MNSLIDPGIIQPGHVHTKLKSESDLNWNGHTIFYYICMLTQLHRYLSDLRHWEVTQNIKSQLFSVIEY